MRADMHKVICERERRGSRDYNPGKGYDRGHRNRDAEDNLDQLDSLPRHESMTVRLGYERRTFNENLEQVGRPWDKVKSEMTQIVGHESTIHRHVWQHVKDFVSENVVEVGGKLYERWAGWRYRSFGGDIPGTNLRPLKKGDGFIYLFVHPRTGLLHKNKEYRGGRISFGGYTEDRAKMLAARMRKTDDPMVQLHKLDGLWYRVDLVKRTALSGPDPLAKYYPVSYGRVEGPHAFYGLDEVVASAATRRILSKKDLKAYGLTNDARSHAA